MINARFDLYDGDDGWTAQTHCSCGTTRSGHGPYPTEAAAEAMESMADHLMMVGDHTPLVSVSCACDQCKAHDSKLTELLSTTV